MKAPRWFSFTALALGLAFLYLPVCVLVVYSFNDSRLVTVWAGFSTRWYVRLLEDTAFLDAARMTLYVAGISSTLATMLGVLAGYSLARMGRFKGRLLFSSMIYAPIVMPEILTGLSLLLLFIAAGLTRGAATIILAHTTFAMCYVSVVVSARLSGVDATLEEAARDLGCRAFEAFWRITLPQIAPAIIAGWLLAFTLSIDDLVIASFTSGPSATTLPIRIFSSIRLGVDPRINALSTILIALVTLCVITASIVMKRFVAGGPSRIRPTPEQ